MRRIPTDALVPGMKVGHNIYNSWGMKIISQGISLSEKNIASLKSLGVPALYIIDESLPGFYLEDVIDEKSRVAAMQLAKKILEGATTPVGSPLNKSLMDDTRDVISDIINQLLDNSNLMVNMLDIRSVDDYLFGHSVNVSVLALIGGISLGYSEDRLMTLGIGAFMHDLGKTLITPRILNKPGTLTAEEFNMVKKHPEYGHSILNNIRYYLNTPSALIALQHHERYNGEGYPGGLKDVEIHEFSQLVGMADIYDAMTSDRVYRKAHPPNEAYELLAGSGDYWFQYRLVKSFLQNIAAYPAGSLVRLSTGEMGLVLETPKGFPLYPKVRLLYNKKGKRMAVPVDIDMSERHDLTIIKILESNDIKKLQASYH